MSDKTRWRQGCFLASTADKVETYAIRLGGWVDGVEGTYVEAALQLDGVEEGTCL